VFIKLEFGQLEWKTKINISIDNRITITDVMMIKKLIFDFKPTKLSGLKKVVPLSTIRKYQD